MSDKLAKEIISLRDREKARQSNFRNLWQSVSELIFPQTFGISDIITPGTELMNELFDTTAVEESEGMTSGLVTNLFPPGQLFFALGAGAGVKPSYQSKRYLQLATEATHEEIFNSNFISQVSNTIQYWLTFGTGAIYSDWSRTDGLSFRDYAIGTYQCLENSRGIIDTIVLTCPKTARQIVQDYGKDESKVGRSVAQSYAKAESKQESFDVIQVIRPRVDHDVNTRMRPANRMPFENIVVQATDQIVLEEGGFDEFPFAVPRYQVIYRETYGRGRGTTILPKVRILNRLARDYMEMSNKWVNPPREILESFEGNVDVTPGANNFVAQMGSIKPIDMGANGMYPVTKDILEYRREEIKQGFFHNAFAPLTDLQGDRRNTTEIIERLKEGMKQASKPLGRLFTELLTPVIQRSVLLSIRNGVIQAPPPDLQGTPLKVTFINPLALALRDQQSRGLQYWVAAGAEMEQVFPGIVDNVNADEAYRDLGESMGVKTTHIRKVEEVEALREQKAQAAAQQQQAEMAMAAAESYGKSTKAPEQGSAAAALMGAGK